MDDNSPEKKSGCNLLNAVFGRRGIWQRRTSSSGSLPSDFVKFTPSTPDSKRRKGGNDDPAPLDPMSNGPHTPPKPVTKPCMNTYRAPQSYQQNQPRKLPKERPIMASNGGGSTKPSPTQGYVSQGRRVPREAIGISGELESIIQDHQKTKGSGSLVRASSGNVMLYSNLGNLRKPGGGGTTSNNVMDYLPKTAKEGSYNSNGQYTDSHMGSVAKTTYKEEKKQSAEQPTSLCRALSTRMDPETLKIMGNEDYKNGRFAEALALYDAAINIDPNKASYRSNKSAALTALGQILDAVFECREAIRIEPNYPRAHHRLATLYLRLGDAEKATYHYKHAGLEADNNDLAKVRVIQGHLNKCTEAKRLRDWNSLIKETNCALSAGADSAPQIYALQAEALLKLNRHQEADEAMSRGPNFAVDACTKFFGPIGYANLLVIRAKVNLTAGRFDDAMEATQRAARLDSNNKEVNMLMRNSRAVAAARSNGNEIFKASRFQEACAAYDEGLEHAPNNSVLLCNRAACRSKLGQFERAIEDCNAALNVRPSYLKARLRRADCNAKLEKWEASIHDYETLLKEMPGDEEVSRALFDMQVQLKKQRGEDVRDMKYIGPESVFVS